MKHFRNTIILLVVFAALLGYYFYAQKGAKPVESPYVLDIKKNDITFVDIKSGNTDMVNLSKKSGKWMITTPLLYKADSIALDETLSTLTSLKPNRKFKDTNLNKYGLKSPSFEINIGLKDGKSQILQIGSQSPVGNAYYLKTRNAPYIYVVDGTTVQKLMQADAYQYADKYIFSTSRDKIDKITFLQPSKEYTVIKGKNKKWSINKKEIKDATINKLLDDLVLLQNSGLDTSNPPTPNKYDFGVIVYNGKNEEKVLFTKKDNGTSYMIKDGKSLGLYLNNTSVDMLKNDLSQILK